MAKNKTKSTSKSKKRKIWAKIIRIISYSTLVFVLLSILSVFIYIWVNPPITPLMIIRKIEDGNKINKTWVELEKISPNLITAAVAGEDANFMNHSGFDFEAIEKAIEKNESGKKIRGGSTISQQVAKNVFLWPNRSWIRKGFEAYFTLLIEIFWSKERIMEVYLNVIEMGDGIYGAEAASQKYFKKSASKLNINESALLTACYPNPRIYFPDKPSATVIYKKNIILRNMSRIKRVKFD